MGWGTKKEKLAKSWVHGRASTAQATSPPPAIFTGGQSSWAVLMKQRNRLPIPEGKSITNGEENVIFPHMSRDWKENKTQDYAASGQSGKQENEEGLYEEKHQENANKHRNRGRNIRLRREGGGGQTTTLAHTWEEPPCCVKETDVGWKASSNSASQLLDTE